ncbi:MAG: hypothetical protein D6820_16300, partial [Lentisphaerae bacterium]
MCSLGMLLANSAVAEKERINKPAHGFHGIWYMNQPTQTEYVYKYSGGLGTYCAKHRPLAVYAPQVNKTFFVYGGAPAGNPRKLLHLIASYDHKTGLVSRPTLILDKETDDAHDNPVLSIDAEGYLWVFSTSHGISRPSYISRSEQPWSIDKFIPVHAYFDTPEGKRPFDNFSYFQVDYSPELGFQVFYTHYHDPAVRTLFYTRSRDGVRWIPPIRVAAIDEGHYHVSCFQGNRAGVFFNYHPFGKKERGLNWRTNLYYLETRDGGTSWTDVDGQPVELPLTTVGNSALVHDFAADGRLVYLKDAGFAPGARRFLPRLRRAES